MASDSATRQLSSCLQFLHLLKLTINSAAAAVLAVLLSVVIQNAAEAQAVTWTRTDLGTTGITGTYSYSSGTYTVGGGGDGVGGTSDNFTYVSTPTSGNFELVARVASQTNTSNYANAGLMLKSTLSASGAMAMVGVTPGNGVNFVYRTADGATSSTTLGASLASPVYLKLVRSQNTVAGYRSSDGINWTEVGRCQMSLPGAFYAGFAVTSAVPGTLSTATFTNQNFMVNVPQRSANLKLWLRADDGVTYSGNKVLKILDQSGNGNNAAQATTSKQPTLSTSALNGLPAINFNGTSQLLALGAGFADFTSGASIFLVTKPTTVTNNVRFFDFGNGATNNNLYMSESASTTANLFVYNGSSASSLAASGSIAAGSFSLLEAVHSGAATATVYSNGVQKATGAINNIPNVSRTGNFIGTNYANNSFFNGQICEMLCYSAPLTSSQRNQLESYFLSKYGIGAKPTLAPPVISPGTGVYSGTTSVTITATPGAAIYYTTNGTAPSTSSTLYTGAFNISSTSTVQAIAWMTPQFYNTSAVSSSLIQIDSNTANVRRSNLQLWLKSDAGVTTAGASNVTQWSDMSGNGMNATQGTSANRPTLAANSINGLPAINFSGTNQFLNLPAGFASFSGSTIFAVVKPNTVTAGDVIIDLATTASTNNNIVALGVAANTGSVAYHAFNGATGGTLTSPTGVVAANVATLLTATQDNSTLAKIFNNGVQVAQGAVQVIPNITRGINGIGLNSAYSTNYLHGKIAELLVYNTELSASERTDVEAYLFAKYALKVSPPKFTTATGVYSGTQTVFITADPGAQIFTTNDGSQPTTSSTPYAGGITVSSATTLKAIASQSFGTSAVSTITVQIDPKAASVPRNGMNLWLMGDAGILTNGSNVVEWADLSNSGNNAAQTTNSNRPALATNAINGLPAVSFNGSSRYLQCPTGFADFTAGSSAFIVTKPSSIVNNARFFDFGNGNANNNVYLSESTVPASSANFVVYSGSTPSSLNSTANKLTAGSYQLLEEVSGAGSASIYTNNVLAASGTVFNIANVSRTTNLIGIDAGKTAATSFNGQIAEMLLYNRPVTGAERQKIESYLRLKYGVNPAPTLDAPTFSLASGVYGSAQTLQIFQSAGQPVRITTDGTTPNASSPLFDPLVGVPIYGTMTVKAIAIAPDFTNSPVSSVTIQVDTNTSTVPKSGLTAWFKSDFGVTTSGSNVTNWTDISNSGYTAAQATSTKQPTLSTNAVNGYPAITFDGSSDYLQLPAGMLDFTAGATIYVVANPTAIVNENRFLDFGQSTATNLNNLTAEEYSFSSFRGTSLISYSNTTASAVTATSGLTAGVFQVLEFFQNAANAGTLATNGSVTASGTVSNPLVVLRSVNTIGAACNATNFFNGKISEILVYNRALNPVERSQVHTYLLRRTGLSGAPAAPTISPNNQVFAGPQTVTISAPSGSQVYYTTNGANPGTNSTPYYTPFTISSSAQIKAIATFGAQSSSVASSFIQIDPSTSNVPRTGMTVWLKDYGVLTSGSNVTDWTDMSGSGYTASQTVASKRPTLVSNAVNGLPAIAFNGSSHFLQAPAGLANFTAGASAFIVTKPNSIVNNARFFDFANGATSNNLYFSETSANNTNLYSYNGSSASHVGASNGVTAGQYQILEAIHDGTGAAFLYTNGVKGGQGLINNINNVSRSGNYFATDFNKSIFFDGQIAEVIIYNTAITDEAQRANIESYLATKYAITSLPPRFSPGTGAYSETQLVTITADPGATIRFTVDGSTPSASSPIFSTPIEVNENTTLKAIAIQPFATSPVATAYYNVDANTKAVPQSGLQLWLKSDYGVETTGSSPFNYVSQWLDVSGKNNHALPGTDAPYLVSSAINGLPTVFNHDLTSPPPATGTLSLPFGFRDFTAGANIFIVTKSLNSSVPAYLLDLGNGAASDNLSVLSTSASTTATFNLYTGSTNHSLSASNGLASNIFEILEAQQSGTNGYIQGNGVTQSGALPVANKVTRSINSIFSNHNGSSKFKGGIAEVLVYDHALSIADRSALLGYLGAKFQFSNENTPPAPIVQPATGTYPEPVEVVMSSPDDTKIWYTVDGTTPSPSGAGSILYNGPIRVYFTQTVKAIAVRNDTGSQSAVTSNTYTLDANRWPAPSAGGPPLQFNLELPTTTQ